MSKKLGIKGLISAAMTAATLSAGAAPAFAATTSTSSDSTVSSSITDRWVTCTSTDAEGREKPMEFSAETDADQLITELTDKIWTDNCIKTINELGANQEDFQDNRFLSGARGAFTSVLRRVCYAKKRTKGNILGLGKKWRVTRNVTQIDNISACISPILKSFIRLNKTFDEKKEDLARGVRLETHSYMELMLSCLNEVDAEVKNLPTEAESVMRNMLFNTVFGDKSMSIDGLRNRLLVRPDMVTVKVDKKLEETKNSWKARIKDLEKIANQGGTEALAATLRT